MIELNKIPITLYCIHHHKGTIKTKNAMMFKVSFIMSNCCTQIQFLNISKYQFHSILVKPKYTLKKSN